MIKCESQLANLQSDYYNNKLQAYKSVKDSFARKTETEIIASNPAKYIYLDAAEQTRCLRVAEEM